MLKQVVELGPRVGRGCNGERETAAGASQRASSSHELVANGAERA